MNLISNLTNDNIIEEFKNLDTSYTPLNVLDLISTIGSLTNKYINDFNYKNSFININKALSSPKGTSSFISGILAKLLQNQGINVTIEEKITCPKLTKSLLDWLMIGLLKFRKIELHLNYGKKKIMKFFKTKMKKIN